MATEITKEKLFNDLNEIKDALEFPDLYLANYFDVLRSDVDKAFVLKQLEFQNDKEKNKQIDELWQQMINIIDTFEKNCTIDSCDLEPNKKRINEIEAILNTINLGEAQYMIEEEEINLLQDLFQNKSILFIETNMQVESKLIEGSLVILNNTYISKKSIKKR